MRGRLLGYLAFVNEAIVVIATAIDIVLTFVSTVARYAYNQDIPWSADASSILISIIAFLGAPAYYRRGTGMAYTAVLDATGGRTHRALKASGLWLVLAVCLISLYLFPRFFTQQMSQMLPVLGLSDAWASIWLCVGLVLMVVYCIEKFTVLDVGSAALGFLLVTIVAAAVAGLRVAYGHHAVGVDPFLPILFVLIAAFITAAPIAIILALGGILYIMLTGAVPMVAIPASYQAGIGSYILLAIPFFMLAGTLMEVTGMARRLIDMVQEWIGHWPGGLLLAQVVAMYIFSGISGSKAADVATVGSIMKGPLRRYGYPPSESVAVLAASAAMGEVVPPSLGLLILGSITSLSVASLFVAGIVPAAVLAVVLMIAIVIRSRSKNWLRGPAFRLGRALRSMPAALPALGVPVIVIGGIVGGIASPTESSSFAVVYGFAASLVVYRSLGLRASWEALRDSALTAGMVLFMIGTANLLSQTLVIDGLARALGTAFGTLHNQTAFLFLGMAVLIVVGFVLEGFPAILISAPILLPVATRMGVDPLQFGILLTMAIGIGVFMPPVGIGYYISCAIGDAPVHETMRPSALYNVILILGLCIVIIFPQITLALPHYFGMN